MAVDPKPFVVSAQCRGDRRVESRAAAASAMVLAECGRKKAAMGSGWSTGRAWRASARRSDRRSCGGISSAGTSTPGSPPRAASARQRRDDEGTHRIEAADRTGDSAVVRRLSHSRDRGSAELTQRPGVAPAQPPRAPGLALRFVPFPKGPARTHVPRLDRRRPNPCAAPCPDWRLPPSSCPHRTPSPRASPGASLSRRPRAPPCRPWSSRSP